METHCKEEVNMTIDEMLTDIRNQFEAEENCTAYGEPQAWICLENGRGVEMVHEEECLPPDEQYFRIILHCTDDEFDNGYCHGSCGVISSSCSYDTPNALDIEAVRRPLEYIIRVNESEQGR